MKLVAEYMLEGSRKLLNLSVCCQKCETNLQNEKCHCTQLISEVFSLLTNMFCFS